MPTLNINMGSKENIYYYFDDIKNKIRYIVLDLYENNWGENVGFGVAIGFSYKQVDWFLNTALDDEKYNFIIVSYAPADSGVSSDWYEKNIK